MRVTDVPVAGPRRQCFLLEKLHVALRIHRMIDEIRKWMPFTPSSKASHESQVVVLAR